MLASVDDVAAIEVGDTTEIAVVECKTHHGTRHGDAEWRARDLGESRYACVHTTDEDLPTLKNSSTPSQAAAELPPPI